MTWLFVYGTLRSGGTAASFLEGAAIELRPAVLTGYALYGRTAPYPSVAPCPDGTVVGEAVLLDPERTSTVLAELDRYEGDEYRRTTAEVVAGGQQLVAHLWCAVDPEQLRENERILSGDWFER